MSLNVNPITVIPYHNLHFRYILESPFWRNAFCFLKRFYWPSKRKMHKVHTQHLFCLTVVYTNLIYLTQTSRIFISVNYTDHTYRARSRTMFNRQNKLNRHNVILKYGWNKIKQKNILLYFNLKHPVIILFVQTNNKNLSH